MSATMIERVARAIHDAGKAPWEPLWHEFGGLDRNLKQRALAAARAAIAAMREPSARMVNAGEVIESTGGENNDSVGIVGALRTWTAMIDAALAEDPS